MMVPSDRITLVIAYSPAFLVGVKSRPGLVKGCTRDLLEWFWAKEA
jgi:hypothetical protein